MVPKGPVVSLSAIAGAYLTLDYGLGDRRDIGLLFLWHCKQWSCEFTNRRQLGPWCAMSSTFASLAVTTAAEHQHKGRAAECGGFLFPDAMANCAWAWPQEALCVFHPGWPPWSPLPLGFVLGWESCTQVARCWNVGRQGAVYIVKSLGSFAAYGGQLAATQQQESVF